MNHTPDEREWLKDNPDKSELWLALELGYGRKFISGADGKLWIVDKTLEEMFPEHVTIKRGRGRPRKTPVSG